MPRRSSQQQLALRAVSTHIRLSLNAARGGLVRYEGVAVSDTVALQEELMVLHRRLQALSRFSGRIYGVTAAPRARLEVLATFNARHHDERRTAAARRKQSEKAERNSSRRTASHCTEGKTGDLYRS
ncbi:hypothetical protein BU23DRAFT_147548 [Bimuria novae-zelandiae CBS 107.79]|uniref:Uncharacterized protein n=1 Tax=Bimuria novae-zelandiae CBS 107.79 TaxID=1447943 RepID=A0A6A5V7A5_9PLEO|nr:hypothetical protein BU23DRAFT_147548 [Bimuria novae-zelandiae CBS 107.79]